MNYVKFWLDKLNEYSPKKESQLNLASRQWYISDHWRDEDGETKCVCGQEGIVDCYEITNKYSHKILSPVGSTCIQKFEFNDLNYQMEWTLLFSKLRDASPETKFGMKNIVSRKAIDYAYDKHWIENKRDYDFLVKTFNKRIKTIEKYTDRQKRKIKAILYFEIKKNWLNWKKGNLEND